ncbi:hypothetical protein CROQUDRAFT_651076 [Cronartium quercuum f. sp. fusiforme G11]|uniref:Aminotransferase class I/classII large domain-containing protein n=1 Tax=Cronartium quercuum f. sp. fusiforme G11 TaxID=708437 RepID=A0A9P6NYA4_9BASI|nr:hypothetical protein CROQUDRAFT_651076 [Cronartium quercuum f. sp. fusiforme G11]
MPQIDQPSTGLTASEKVQPELEKGLDCWSVFSPASGHMPKDSLNLGQGFMNWAPPAYIKVAASDALEDISANHYSLPKGRIRLRKAVAEHLSESFDLGRPLDAENEVVISAGANMGIFATLLAFCSQGDEVILMEPFFDQYIRNITFAGGKPVYVPLRPPTIASHKNVSSKAWTLNLEELRAVITPKSKIIILNTPHNPIGKVFSAKELKAIGEIAEEHNLLIIADEVYDCLTFDEPHVRIASLSPALWNRTITVGSAGKSFSATGWRVGWCIGPQKLLAPVLAVLTRTVFCSVSPLQEAIAAGFEGAKKEHFFETQLREYRERRDLMMSYLDKLRLPYTQPDGSYFILVQNSKIKIPDDFEMIDIVKNRPRDWHVSWFIAKVAGIVCIPPSDFYSSEHVSIAENFTRIAFCKDLKLSTHVIASTLGSCLADNCFLSGDLHCVKISTLKEAGERLQKLKPYLI